MVLQSEYDAGVGSPARGLDQRFTAPVPDLFGRDVFVGVGPDPLSVHVGSAARRSAHAGPACEDPHGFTSQIGRHAQKLPDKKQLAFAVLLDGVRKIVIGGDSVDLDSLTGRLVAQLTADVRREAAG